MEVSPKSESSSWTIPPEALSATSRAQVRLHHFLAFRTHAIASEWALEEDPVASMMLTFDFQSAKTIFSACSSPNVRPED